MGTLKLNPNFFAISTKTPHAIYKSPIALSKIVLNLTYPLFCLFLSLVSMLKLSVAIIQKIFILLLKKAAYLFICQFLRLLLLLATH